MGGLPALSSKAKTLPHGRQLLKLAQRDAGLDEVLEELADATTGGGWSTGGMLGGSGYCLYVRSSEALQELVRQCESLADG